MTKTLSLLFLSGLLAAMSSAHADDYRNSHRDTRSNVERSLERIQRSTEFRFDQRTTARPTSNGIAIERRGHDNSMRLEAGRVRMDGLQNRNDKPTYGARFNWQF